MSGYSYDLEDAARTASVLEEIGNERSRQVERYGHNDDFEDFPGPHNHWLHGTGNTLHLLNASELEAVFRLQYEEYEAAYGTVTWMHLVREEIAEAFAETDPQRLEEELVQVAALCVSWIETLRKRRA